MLYLKYFLKLERKFDLERKVECFFLDNVGRQCQGDDYERMKVLEI